MTKLGLLIVELLQRDGPMHTPGICKTLGRDYASTVPIMTALLKEGAIKIVGTASKHGFKDVKSSAPVYATTGAKVELTDARELQRIGEAALPPPHYRGKAQQRSQTGSGVIAGKIEIGRGYRWFGGRA